MPSKAAREHAEKGNHNFVPKAKTSQKRKALVIGGKSFVPGQSGTVELTVGHMIDHQPLSMTVHVIRGRRPGPCLLVSAGVHGNEISSTDAAWF